jgi:hypothetical protein
MAIQVKTTYELKNNNYLVKVETINFPQSDLDLIADFGEPTIEMGGTIPHTPSDYVLPTKQAFVKKGFPQTQLFDGVAFADAESRANDWATEILSRITAAMTTLRINTDLFTRQTTDNA